MSWWLWVCDCGGVGLCFGWLLWDSVVWVWVCRRGCGFVDMGCGGFGFAGVGCSGFGFAGVGIVGLGGPAWVWVCRYEFEIGVREGD